MISVNPSLHDELMKSYKMEAHAWILPMNL